MTGTGLVLPRAGGAGIPITLPFFDSFTRANNTDTLGNGWTVEGQVAGAKFGISGNKAYCPTAASFAYAVRDYGTTNVDMSVIISGTDPNELGLVGRYVDTQNHYACRSNSGGGSASIYKLVNGTTTQLATSPFLDTWVSGDTIRFVLNGTSLTVYVNGVLKISATDSSISGTKHGLLSGYEGGQPATVHAWDNFAIVVP